MDFYNLPAQRLFFLMVYDSYIKLLQLITSYKGWFIRCRYQTEKSKTSLSMTWRYPAFIQTACASPVDEVNEGFIWKCFCTVALACVSQPRVEDDDRKIRKMWSDLIYNVCLTFITCVGTRGERVWGRESAGDEEEEEDGGGGRGGGRQRSGSQRGRRNVKMRGWGN